MLGTSPGTPKGRATMALMAQARHYREKLHLTLPGAERGVVQDYVQGLQWVLLYYYRGVASWTWFYPHHYAPLASDIVHTQDLQVNRLWICCLM